MIRKLLWLSLMLGIAALVAVFLMLRVSVVTDRFYHTVVKDPERTAPAGNSILSPADGRIIYIKPIENGILPEVVKRGVPIPLEEVIKQTPDKPLENGYLIGIYMNTESVHVQRAPFDGRYVEQIVFNGPHMSMMEMDRKVILTQLVPGWVSMRKALGIDPYAIEEHGDYVLKSARETSVFEDENGQTLYMIRIADFWVGKILTWASPGDELERGERFGMITWGSQVDVCFATEPNLEIQVAVGDYVRAGETILATR